METVIAFALTGVYWLRPDIFSALTILPAWTWLFLVVPVLPFLRRRHLRYSIIFLSAWVLFLVLHVEEPRSLARGLMGPVSKQKPPGTLRLVTINCAGGQKAVLHEIKKLEPDIVFLQESPRKSDIALFVHELFGTEGAYLYGFDTSILVRGKLSKVKQGDHRRFFIHATINFPGRGPIDLVSLRLATGNIRTDLWNPACWNDHLQHRRRQINQVQRIVMELPESHLIVVAGDFNAPQGDRVFSFLPATLYDTFAMAGKGIGNTILNDMPVLRIDQIWVSRDFVTLQSFSRQTTWSDHRMVVSDIKEKGSAREQDNGG